MNFVALNCSKCGNKVCKLKAVYYKPPLRDLCVNCRQIELEKLEKEKK